jgi:hypothetical protein
MFMSSILTITTTINKNFHLHLVCFSFNIECSNKLDLTQFLGSLCWNQPTKVQIPYLTWVLRLQLIILSVLGGILINSEAPWWLHKSQGQSVQSFGGAHRVCVLVSIGVSTHGCLSICVCKKVQCVPSLIPFSRILCRFEKECHYRD